MTWLSEDEAMKRANRARFTLRDWRIAGIVQARKSNGMWFFDADSLKLAVQQMERNYRLRRIVPGPGRGHARTPNQPPLWEDDDVDT